MHLSDETLVHETDVAKWYENIFTKGADKKLKQCKLKAFLVVPKTGNKCYVICDKDGVVKECTSAEDLLIAADVFYFVRDADE